MKAQPVRLVDFFILGPFMIWSGMNAKGIPAWAKLGLVIAGATTIAYNGQNYLRIAKEQNELVGNT